MGTKFNEFWGQNQQFLIKNMHWKCGLKMAAILLRGAYNCVLNKPVYLFHPLFLEITLSNLLPD